VSVSTDVADFEVVARGFHFCEALRIEEEGTVWFSDLTGGGMYSVRDGIIRTRLADRIWIGGATLDQAGAFVCSGRGGLVLVDVEGRERPLLTEIANEPIIAVNDIEADERGGLFGGTIDFRAVFERQEKPTGGCFFHLATDGVLTVFRDDVVTSNGIGFSPDQTTLYHSESTVGLWAWRRDTRGMPADRRLLVALDDCDGLAVDVEGFIWVAFWKQAAIVRFRPDGEIDRRITLPLPSAISLAFGGCDRRDLYVTTSADSAAPDAGGVIRLRVEVPGLPTHRSCFA
jgi:sugar lactone lactonase YvrE